MQHPEPRLEGETRPRLSEEGLIPGRPWTHPDTRLEYADFASYFVGQDPLPHWRNAQVKAFARRKDGDAVFKARSALLRRTYSRKGYSEDEKIFPFSTDVGIRLDIIAKCESGPV